MVSVVSVLDENHTDRFQKLNATDIPIFNQQVNGFNFAPTRIFRVY
jgi:hypothetical protein